MRTVVSLCVAAGLLLPAQATAQSWTTAEQELVEAIETCWQRYKADENPEAWASICGATAESPYWWTPETTPGVGLKWSQANNAAAFASEDLLAQDLRPIQIRLSGEFGVIWYHGIRTWRDQHGERYTASWRGMEVWLRTSTGWSFYGGMGTPDVT